LALVHVWLPTVLGPDLSNAKKCHCSPVTGEQHLKPNCHFGPAIRLDGLLPFEDGSVLWHTSQGKAQRNGCFVEWLACLEYG
jgi:hypothetical protein